MSCNYALWYAMHTKVTAPCSAVLTPNTSADVDADADADTGHLGVENWKRQIRLHENMLHTHIYKIPSHLSQTHARTHPLTLICISRVDRLLNSVGGKREKAYQKCMAVQEKRSPATFALKLATMLKTPGDICSVGRKLWRTGLDCSCFGPTKNLQLQLRVGV